MGDPQVCGSGGYLPEELVPAALALETRPGLATTQDVGRHLRCTLETHGQDQPHWAIVLELAGVDTGSVWTSWPDGEQPEGLRVVADCPALDGDSGYPCSGYARHLGLCDFALHDPLDEVSRTLSR